MPKLTDVRLRNAFTGKMYGSIEVRKVPREGEFMTVLAPDTGGYPPDRPVFMWVWLMILADNTIHVILNGVALKWLAV